MFLSALTANTVLYNLPLFYQIVFDLSAGQAGLRLMPYSLGAALESLGYGYLIGKTVGNF
jgi:hypothetical protein